MNQRFYRSRIGKSSCSTVMNLMLAGGLILAGGCGQRSADRASAPAGSTSETESLASPPPMAAKESGQEEEQFQWADPESLDEENTESEMAFALPEQSKSIAPSIARSSIPPASRQSPSMATLPAGSQRTDSGYATVQVYYATDRAADPVSLADYDVTGDRDVLKGFTALALLFVTVLLFGLLRRRRRTTVIGVMGVSLAGIGITLAILGGRANIEKHGVTYTGDRGTLVRGVCEVTVPDSHQRGVVERPSLLRFEMRENQAEHIVLVSSTELANDDFHRRLSRTVETSPDRDLLVFIHGYNVDHPSAVRRTAQIAVDLPFRGVPVCYSWPSQGTVLGYTIDENNVAWSASHLKSFLLELAQRSGAEAINVVAHSMGNRAMTSAISEIALGVAPDAPPTFQNIVMAAPDVDADTFRKDLAPRLTRVAKHVTLYASSDDNALIASKKIHGYPRAGESGPDLVVVQGIETIDVTGIDLSLLGHSYYGDSGLMLRDLFDLVHGGLAASQRTTLRPQPLGALTYWQLAKPPVRVSLRDAMRR